MQRAQAEEAGVAGAVGLGAKRLSPPPHWPVSNVAESWSCRTTVCDLKEKRSISVLGEWPSLLLG